MQSRLREWVASRLRSVANVFAGVAAVPPGRDDDGLVSLEGAGGRLDPSWYELSMQLSDALEAWRKNPLARRLISLVTSYVVADGIRLSSRYRPLARFLADFAGDQQNLLDLRQTVWCDTLGISGELFVTLHLNRANGMSYVRLVPAAVIDHVSSRPGDYETELEYHEAVPIDDPDASKGGRTWLSPWHPDANRSGDDGSYPPVVLHFAVNRPAGCLRGESDLAVILPWLKRYNRWLEDRVRLNAAVRAFLWIVRVPQRLINQKTAQYQVAPEPGSVIVAEDAENWQAVAPDLKATDAQADGRAIRWMVAAGGLGTSLVDMGEMSDANLATAKAAAEQRARFMRARQSYFGFVLAQTALTAYNRAVRLGFLRGGEKTLADIQVGYPDISPADNADLGNAASSLANALASVQGAGYGGEQWRRLVLRLVLKFAGENVSDDDLEQMLVESEEEEQQRQEQAPPAPAPQQPVPVAPRNGTKAGAAQSGGGK
jgi:hypothetical protein